jgi:hypothetical protein
MRREATPSLRQFFRITAVFLQKHALLHLTLSTNNMIDCISSQILLSSQAKVYGFITRTYQTRLTKAPQQPQRRCDNGPLIVCGSLSTNKGQPQFEKRHSMQDNHAESRSI